MTRNLKIIWTFFRLSALNEAQYRVNFWLELLYGLIGMVTAIGGLAVVFAQTDDLNGWDQNELLALIGIYYFVGSMIAVVIEPSMHLLMENVRRGTFDYTLTKPADSQLLASIGRIHIWSLIRTALALAVIGVAILRLGGEVGALDALNCLVSLLAGTAIVYSFLLILATTAFWFVRVENILVVFAAMYEAGRWPIGIYPGWMRAGLTFLVPVAFAITVPASGLIGELDWVTLLGSVGLALALLVVSRWFWRLGIRHYSGASA